MAFPWKKKKKACCVFPVACNATPKWSAGVPPAEMGSPVTTDGEAFPEDTTYEICRLDVEATHRVAACNVSKNKKAQNHFDHLSQSKTRKKTNNSFLFQKKCVYLHLV